MGSLICSMAIFSSATAFIHFQPNSIGIAPIEKYDAQIYKNVLFCDLPNLTCHYDLQILSNQLKLTPAESCPEDAEEINF